MVSKDDTDTIIPSRRYLGTATPAPCNGFVRVLSSANDSYSQLLTALTPAYCKLITIKYYA